MASIEETLELPNAVVACEMIRKKLSEYDAKSKAYDAEIGISGKFLHSLLANNRWCRLNSGSLMEIRDLFSEFPELSSESWNLFVSYHVEEASTGKTANGSSASCGCGGGPVGGGRFEGDGKN